MNPLAPLATNTDIVSWAIQNHKGPLRNTPWEGAVEVPELLKQLLPTNAEEEVMSPNFAGGTRTHNWRHHIPTPVQLIWSTLSQETRLTAFLIAQAAADKEQWD